MPSFDESFQQALSGRKYDVLTGRAPNIRETAIRLLTNAYEKIIKPLLDKLKFTFPDATSGINAVIIRNIFITVVVLLLAASAFIIYKRLNHRSYRKKTMQEIFNELKNNTVTYEKLLLDADSLAKSGHYRDAIRYEYISLLWVFNTHSIIYLTDYKTNSQIKREILKNASELHEAFTIIVNIFDFSWFGHKTVSEEAYRNNRSNINRLIGEAHNFEKTA